MPELIPAVAYYRMSSRKQDTSIAQQRERVEPHFDAKYRTVEEYIDEGKSGSKNTAKRVAFLRMIHDLTAGKYKGKVRHVVCLDLSRFGRLDTLDGAEYKKALRAARVKLDTVIDGLIDWSSSTGRIVDSVKSEGNNELSLKIGEKGLHGRIKATLKGRPNQTTPYGMAKLVTNPETGLASVIARGTPFATPKTWASKFVPGDPVQVEAVKFLFETFDTQDLSFRQIAGLMNKRGFPSPTGLGWQGQMLRCILRNPVYVGDLRIGYKPKGAFFRVHEGREKAVADIETPAAPVVAQGCHEGIIARELFDRVQVKLARVFKKRVRTGTAGPYPLSGIITCGVCGRDMYGSRNPVDGRIMYRCHRGELDPTQPCGYWIAWEEKVLPVVCEQFLTELRQTVADLAARGTDAVADSDSEADGKKLKRLDAKLTQARERFLTAPPSVAEGLLEVLKRLEAEKKDLQAKVAAPRDADLAAALDTDELDRAIEFGSGVKVPRHSVLPPECHAEQFVAYPEIPREKFESSDPVLCNVEFLPAAAFRETLKRIKAKVQVWFRKKERRKGYDLVRIRVRAEVGGELRYEYSSKAAS